MQGLTHMTTSRTKFAVNVIERGGEGRRMENREDAKVYIK